MALYTSPLISISPVTHAKRSGSNSPIMHGPCLTLRPHSLVHFHSSSLGIPIPAKFLRALGESAPQKYVYPDPIPEFAEAESEKFRVELLKKLTKEKETFGNDLNTVVNECTEVWILIRVLKVGIPALHSLHRHIQVTCIVLSWSWLRSRSEVIEVLKSIYICCTLQFLHKEYGGPGTLLIEPFTDMLVALKEKKLPGAPLAARSSLLWAQKHLDQDWDIWNT